MPPSNCRKETIMCKWVKDDESVRREGPPEERDLNLERYLWSRVKRVELALAEANKEIYRLHKALYGSSRLAVYSNHRLEEQNATRSS